MAKSAKKEEPTKAIAKTGPSAVAKMPSYLKEGDTRGKETITKDDIRIGRVAVAHQMSKELIPGTERYIDGLKVSDVFDTQKKEVLSKPLEFCVIQNIPRRWIQFAPQDEGGHIIDRDIKSNDPRTRFREGGQKPIATEFKDFLVMMLPPNFSDPLDSIRLLSCKSSNLGMAKDLTTLLSRRKGPIFAGKFSLDTKMKTNNRNQTFPIFAINNSEAEDESTLREDDELMTGWVSNEVFALAEQAWKTFMGKTVIAADVEAHGAERTAGEDDDVDEFQTEDGSKF